MAGSDAVLVNEGFLFAGILLVLLGAYHLVAGWNLDVDERDALVAATKQVGFAVGHASGAAGLAGPAQPADLADPAVLGRGPTAEAWARAGGRRRRRDRRPLRGGQPGGLERPRPSRPPPAHSEQSPPTSDRRRAHLADRRLGGPQVGDGGVDGVPQHRQRVDLTAAVDGARAVSSRPS